MGGLEIYGPGAASVTQTQLAADAPHTKVLAANTGDITANTTLANVTGLFVPVGASATEIWFAEFVLLVSAANATMDAKFGFTVPASCTMLHGTASGLASEIASFADRSVGNVKSLLAAEGATTSVATGIGTSGTSLTALIFGGGTAGNVQLQIAQATSDPGVLKLLKGSFVRYVKLQA